MSIFRIHFDIEKSIIIDTSVDNIWEYIVDTEKKNIWSPWLILEKKCSQKTKWKSGTVWYKESWKWDVVWTGEQTITDILKNYYIKYDLNFLKPFKANNQTSFHLEKISDSSTKLIWGMCWSLPLFLFFLKKMMITYVWNDFDRGLKMLKVLVEKWKLETETLYSWTEILDKKYYIWTKSQSNTQDLWEKIYDNFSSLINIAKEHNILILSYFTIYNKSDLVKDYFEFEACIEISENDYSNFKLPIVSTYFMWYTDEMKVAVTSHKWSYDFIDNSWTGAYMYLKPNKLKVNKRYSPIELYEVWFFDKVGESKYLTHILIPVK